MNVNDFEAPPTPEDWPSILRAIFRRQRELMDRYKQIEGLPNPPVSLHHASGQRVLKDFAWRATEELAESWEAKLRAIGSSDEQQIALHVQHQIEELADALHFLVELLIFAGISAETCIAGVSEPRPDHAHQDHVLAYWRATYELGLAMNFCKNKPWKQSQMPTDERRLRAQLIVALQAQIEIWTACRLGMGDLFNYYFRKAEVNAFRQRSNY